MRTIIATALSLAVAVILATASASARDPFAIGVGPGGMVQMPHEFVCRANGRCKRPDDWAREDRERAAAVKAQVRTNVSNKRKHN